MMRRSYYHETVDNVEEFKLSIVHFIQITEEEVPSV